MWVGNLLLVILSLPLVEEKLPKALSASHDDRSACVTRFISLAAVLPRLVVIPFERGQRKQSFRAS